MSLIKAECLSLKKGSFYLVDNVDWTIEKGENWVLFGANGCGKTTLLSMLAAYQSGNSGSVSLFDREVDEENFIELRQRIGFVSSSFFGRYLHTESVEDIVLAGKFGTLGIHGEITDGDVRKMKALGRSLGIERKLRYPYDQLSRGQQQRALIARALMSDPEVLLLDEPCSGLDLIGRETFLHDVQNMAEQRHVAIVYVTHHTEEILPFFNKVALMKQGKIVMSGDLHDVFTDEVLTDFFGVKAQTVWTDNHFFISLDLGCEQEGKRVFGEVIE